MKKIYIILLTVILIFCTILVGCKEEEPVDGQNTSEQEQENQNQNEEESQGYENEGRGDLFDESVPEGTEEIRQGVYYSEFVEMLSGYGEGISPREGADLADELLASIGFYSGDAVPAEKCLYISFDELANVDLAMGNECYIYSVGLGTAEGGPTGSDCEPMFRIAVDYGVEKKAYMYEDLTGKGDIIEDEVPWLGVYLNSDETKSLSISDFDGTSFKFDITTADGMKFDGAAEVDGSSAYYMDMIFAMSINFNDVSIWIDEPQADSVEREPFVDTYFRNNNETESEDDQEVKG